MGEGGLEAGVGMVYEMKPSESFSFISVTDENDTTGSQLLREGWKCYGHGGFGEIFRPSSFPPPPVADPKIFPRCDTLSEYLLLRTPTLLLLQMSSRARLRPFL